MRVVKSCRIFLVTSPRLPWLQTLSISGLRSLKHHSPTPAECQRRLRHLEIVCLHTCRSFPSLQNFLLSRRRTLNHHSPTVDGWSMKLLMGTRRILSASRSLPILRRRRIFGLPSRRRSHPLLTSTRRSLRKVVRFDPRSSPSLQPVIRIAIRRLRSHLFRSLNIHDVDQQSFHGKSSHLPIVTECEKGTNLGVRRRTSVACRTAMCQSSAHVRRLSI